MWQAPKKRKKVKNKDLPPSDLVIDEVLIKLSSVMKSHDELLKSSSELKIEVWRSDLKELIECLETFQTRPPPSLKPDLSGEQGRILHDILTKLNTGVHDAERFANIHTSQLRAVFSDIEIGDTAWKPWMPPRLRQRIDQENIEWEAGKRAQRGAWSEGSSLSSKDPMEL